MPRPPGRSLAWALLLAGAAPAAAASYEVDARASSVVVHVGKAGLFKFAGHAHEVRAPVAEGRIEADTGALARSSVFLAFETASLQVAGEDEPPADQAKVQETMLGGSVLDATRFPRIEFSSQAVAGREQAPNVFELQVEGELRLHGGVKRLVFPVRVELQGELLVATATLSLRQTDFGITPIGAAGLVKVKDQLAIELRVVGRHVSP